MTRRGFADVLAVGELNPDLILTGLSAPAPALGVEQIYRAERLTLGSSTAISCVLMQRLGLRCALASVIGDDDYGQFCLRVLAHEGVDIRLVRVDPAEKTGVTMSLSYRTDRLLLTRLGSMEAVNGSMIEALDLSTFRHVHCGSIFLLGQLRADLPALLESARSAGCSVSVDPGWDPAEVWDRAALQAILPFVDVLLPNRREALAMAGAASVADALADFHSMGAARVAMKDGAAGGVLRTEKGLTRQAGFAVELVDTTGAGDAFNAGFVHGLLQGWADTDCLRLAVACGSIAVTAEGGTGGLTGIDQSRVFVAAAGEGLPND